jgi:hypothetical protein
MGEPIMQKDKYGRRSEDMTQTSISLSKELLADLKSIGHVQEIGVSALIRREMRKYANKELARIRGR